MRGKHAEVDPGCGEVQAVDRLSEDCKDDSSEPVGQLPHRLTRKDEPHLWNCNSRVEIQAIPLNVYTTIKVRRSFVILLNNHPINQSIYPLVPWGI